MVFKKLPDGTGSIIVFAMLFLVPGVISVIKPSVFIMIGAETDGINFENAGNSRLFTAEDTRTLGGGLCIVGFFLLYLAYRHAKSSDE